MKLFSKTIANVYFIRETSDIKTMGVELELTQKAKSGVRGLGGPNKWDRP